LETIDVFKLSLSLSLGHDEAVGRFLQRSCRKMDIAQVNLSVAAANATMAWISPTPRRAGHHHHNEQAAAAATSKPPVDLLLLDGADLASMPLGTTLT
jgi:hypothetical protein